MKSAKLSKKIDFISVPLDMPCDGAEHNVWRRIEVPHVCVGKLIWRVATLN